MLSDKDVPVTEYQGESDLILSYVDQSLLAQYIVAVNGT